MGQTQPQVVLCEHCGSKKHETTFKACCFERSKIGSDGVMLVISQRQLKRTDTSMQLYSSNCVCACIIILNHPCWFTSCQPPPSTPIK